LLRASHHETCNENCNVLALGKVIPKALQHAIISPMDESIEREPQERPEEAERSADLQDLGGLHPPVPAASPDPQPDNPRASDASQPMDGDSSPPEQELENSTPFAEGTSQAREAAFHEPVPPFLPNSFLAEHAAISVSSASGMEDQKPSPQEGAPEAEPERPFEKGDSAGSSPESVQSQEHKARERGSARFRRLVSDAPFDAANPKAVTDPPPELDEDWVGEADIDDTRPPVGRIQAENDEDSFADLPTPPASSPRPAHLPHRVPERDLGGTQVGPAAFAPSAPADPSRRNRIWKFIGGARGCSGCLLRMGILGVFILAALLIGLLSVGLYQYSALAATLPSVEDLQTRAAQFETTRIFDREGNLLYEILDPQAGRRTFVPLADISPFMVAATVATEDSQFYTHPGVDLLAIIRAARQNLQSGATVSGASTITQQVARNLLLNPEERSSVSGMRKIREIMLAMEITRRYTKDEILELYLNQTNYGNLAYGVEAAAETYFDTKAKNLTLAQASFLAGLGQAPSVYDVYTNREVTLGRQLQVLNLMVEASMSQGCIFVSNSPQPLCISAEEAGAAAASMTTYEFSPPEVSMRFPHWVNYVRAELEQLYDPQTIYRSGFSIYTTLDPNLQEQAQQIVQEQIEALKDRRVSNGALVAIRPISGEILAMVGSADFYNEEIDGQVNMAVRPRQPGSSIKPFTYTAAFEKGWTPATLIWDVPTEFPPSGNPDDPRPPYEPVNYDGRFHGPVTVRSALANSYNIPAVKTLNFVGVYRDPETNEEDGLVAFAERMGITTLTRDEYGLSLTLGGGEVTLLEMTGAFAVYANNGLRVPSFAITRIDDHTGETVYQYEPETPEQVIRSEHAYLITSILSDNSARTPAFGPNSALKLPFPAAAKTGTTNDFRDNWTVGYTPDIAVGVWVGNADWTPMVDTSGLSGAAPIWNAFMQTAVQQLTGGYPSTFIRPAGIVDLAICETSGTVPSEWCPSQRLEIFASDQPPLPKEEDLWQMEWIDSWTRLLASTDCRNHAKEKMGLRVLDPWAIKWIKETKQGRAWAEDAGFEDDVYFIPDEICTLDSPQPIVSLTQPDEGLTLTEEGLIEIHGQAGATENFKDWVLQFGIGYNPSDWTRILRSDTQYKEPALLAEWDPAEAGNGPITIRLVVRSTEGGNAEARLHLNLELPTPTPTATPTPTETATPTASPSPTMTPVTPTSTPTLTPTPSPSPSASDTPTPNPSHSPTPSSTP